MSNPSEQLKLACSLVGRFQYHFGRLEQKIDQAVIKLLDLNETTASIVNGSVDFAKKVNFVRTSAYEQASTEEDKKFADDTCGGVFKINNYRQIVVHSSFTPNANGVQFSRTIAKDGRVSVYDRIWDDKDFAKHYTKMEALEEDLDKLIALIKPVSFPPGLPWQSEWHIAQRRPTNMAIHEMSGVVEPVPLSETRKQP